MEDLRKKEEAEAAAMRFKWKANPVPRAVKENRYQAILNQQEARRLKASVARKERLTETLQPFPGLERREKELAQRRIEREEKRRADKERAKAEAKRKKEASARRFRAASAKSAAALQDSGAAAVRRRANIQRRANKLMHSARMPARMEMWQKAQQQKAKTEGSGGDGDGTGSGAGHGKQQLNKVSKMPPGEIKKYFERSQRRFKKELQKARQSRPKAPARPFSFMSKQRLEQDRQRREKTEERIRRNREQDERDEKAHELEMKALAKRLKGTQQVSRGLERPSLSWFGFHSIIFFFLAMCHRRIGLGRGEGLLPFFFISTVIPVKLRRSRQRHHSFWWTPGADGTPRAILPPAAPRPPFQTINPLAPSPTNENELQPRNHALRTTTGHAQPN